MRRGVSTRIIRKKYTTCEKYLGMSMVSPVIIQPFPYMFDDVSTLKVKSFTIAVTDVLR